MSRALTILVQIFLAGGAIVLGRMMWYELKEDFRETVKDLRKQK